MNLASNPAYQPVFTSKVHEGATLYAPADAGSYHQSRYVAASAQEIYNSAGIGNDLLKHMYAEIKKICNDSHSRKDNSGYMDINTMMDNLLYRMQYPVDELCAVRMGAIFCFLPDEAPDELHHFHTQRKVALAVGNLATGAPADPDMYAFFLSMGVARSPLYSALLTTTTGTSYFQSRTEALQGLTPRPCPTV